MLLRQGRGVNFFQGFWARLVRGNYNPGAGLGIGERLVVIEGDPEVSADVGKFRWEKVPGFSGELDGAEVLEFRRCDPVLFAAGEQDLSVKSDVMGGHKIHAFEVASNLRPEFSEIRCVLDILPCQAVDLREEKLLTRGSDQMRGFASDDAVFDTNQSDRARTVARMIRGFKIKGEEVHWGLL